MATATNNSTETEKSKLVDIASRFDYVLAPAELAFQEVVDIASNLTLNEPPSEQEVEGMILKSRLVSGALKSLRKMTDDLEIKGLDRDGGASMIALNSARFEIPQVLTRERVEDDDFEERYDAADEHAKQLRKAVDAIMEANDYLNVLDHSLAETEDYFQITIHRVVKRVEKLLGRASRRIDRHSSAHSNLFFAYFDRNGGPDNGSDS